MNEIDRKKRLRQFLLDRRASLKPRDVGLSDRGGRRCCPGLRREEVADLAGVSVTWYNRQRGWVNFANGWMMAIMRKQLRITSVDR
jgi:hypothetical protein